MKKIAEFYKALGDETRLKILVMLAEKEMCVCELLDQLGMSQPAVSHHLKILKQVGLVKDSREGKWIYYSLSDEVFELIFREEEDFLQSYSEPVRRKLAKLKCSGVRTNPELCEKLTSREQEK